MKTIPGKKNSQIKFETSHKLTEVRVIYKTKNKPKIKINSSKSAFDFLYPLFNTDTIEYTEDFYLLLLNRASEFLGWRKMSSGGTAGTVVDPKIIFTIALKTNANSIILCHNHPSGNLKPSEADKALTNNMKNAGSLLGIELVDHLIVVPGDLYFSFSDEGML